MNNSDLGRVHAYLLRHRMASTHALRKMVSKEEREIAVMLRDADPSMHRLLAEILDGEGFVLIQMAAGDALGIPEGATVFLLPRKPDFESPLFGTERMVTAMRVRGMESDAAAKTWFVQLWFVLLDILYTRRDRSPNALQGWVETPFKKAIFIESVKQYINDVVRKIDVTTLANDGVYQILTSRKEGTVTQLCTAFLQLMCEASLLEDIEADTTYRQTLLFAQEIKLNYDRQLASVLLPTEPFLAASTVLIEESDE